MNRFAWIIAVVGVVSLGASPATKPTSRPTTKPSTRPSKLEPGMVEVKNDTYHFRIVVPKTWKVVKAAEKATVYGIPGPGSATAGGFFVLQSADAVHGQATLDDVVKSKKTSLLEMKPGTKITHEGTCTLGGLAAWKLEYDVPTIAKETVIENGKAGEPKEVTIYQRAIEEMTLNGTTVVDMSYICEVTQFAPREKLAQKVIDSLTWTGDSPTTRESVKESK